MDKYISQCLALKVYRGVTNGDAFDMLFELSPTRGVPRQIRSNNGPQFTTQTQRRWFK
jgi:putative transposase